MFPQTLLTGGDLEAALQNGNHANTAAHCVIGTRLLKDFTYGRVVVYHEPVARRNPTLSSCSFDGGSVARTKLESLWACLLGKEGAHPSGWVLMATFL